MYQRLPVTFLSSVARRLVYMLIPN